MAGVAYYSWGDQGLKLFGLLFGGWYLIYGPIVLWAAKTNENTWPDALKAALAAPFAMIRWGFVGGAIIAVGILFVSGLDTLLHPGP